MNTDIRVIEATAYFPAVHCRTPLKFGAVVVEELPFCHVRAVVENQAGERAEGWGAMLLMDLWGWPMPDVPHQTRQELMVGLVSAACLKVTNHASYAHPIELFFGVLPALGEEADAACRARNLPLMPHLNALICFSPLDAAIHDAFGNVNRIDTYAAYGPDHCNSDLSRYLGPIGTGRYLSEFVKPMPKRLPAYHLVGGLDKLIESEITDDDPNDQLPVSLDQWVRFERLRWLKVKVKGSDLAWDIERYLSVASVAYEAGDVLRIGEFSFTVDANEQCPNPEYMLEFLARVRESNPRAYDDLVYLEQPTERDLEAHAWDMHQLAEQKPVIIDESLTSPNAVDRAVELGWTGIGLKACKCQSNALILAAKAEILGIPYTVQDLTNPGIALIQSVGLAAHLRTLNGVETNSRQFFPSANVPECGVHAGLYRFSEGQVSTESIGGYGLGYRWPEVGRVLEG